MTFREPVLPHGSTFVVRLGEKRESSIEREMNEGENSKPLMAISREKNLHEACGQTKAKELANNGLK
jgi:hypothetical protein